MRLLWRAVSWLPFSSSWRSAVFRESRAAKVKFELSKTADVPIFLKDCLQSAFIYDTFAVHAHPTSPLYDDFQRVAEQAFNACIGMLKYWRRLVKNTTSNASNHDSEITMDITLLQAVTDALGCLTDVIEELHISEPDRSYQGATDVLGTAPGNGSLQSVHSDQENHRLAEVLNSAAVTLEELSSTLRLVG